MVSATSPYCQRTAYTPAPFRFSRRGKMTSLWHFTELPQHGTAPSLISVVIIPAKQHSKSNAMTPNRRGGCLSSEPSFDIVACACSSLVVHKHSPGTEHIEVKRARDRQQGPSAFMMRRGGSTASSTSKCRRGMRPLWWILTDLKN